MFGGLLYHLFSYIGGHSVDSYLETKPYFEESVLTTRSCSYSQNDQGAGKATNDSKQAGNLPRDAAPSFSEYHTCAVCGCAKCQAVFSPVVQAIDLNGQGQSTHPKPSNGSGFGYSSCTCSSLYQHSGNRRTRGGDSIRHWPKCYCHLRGLLLAGNMRIHQKKAIKIPSRLSHA